MSINMGDSGEEYADHEVQVVYTQNQATGTSSNPDQEQDEVIEFEPVSDRGLDSDELAELVGFYRQVAVIAANEADNAQSFVASLTGEVGMGINLSLGEFAEQSNSTGPGNGERVREFSNGYIDKNNYSEPGVLDSVRLSPTNGFIAGDGDPLLGSGAGAGGGGSNVQADREMFFPDKLGSGPFVDRTDDITVHTECEFADFVGTLNVEVAYILYWRVHEMPEGRASFARP